MNQNKLKNILLGVSYFDSKLGDSFKSVEKEIKNVHGKLKTDKEIRTVEEIKSQICGVLDSLLGSLVKLGDEIDQNEKTLVESLNKKLDQLRTVSANLRTADTEQIRILEGDIVKIKSEVKDLSQRKIEIPDFNAQILRAQIEVNDLISKLKRTSEEEFKKNEKDFEKKLEELRKEIVNLRSRTTSGHGGGQANRNILVAGNSSTLSRYTDLNFKPGANVTLTYTNNDNLKTTDVTITGTGGAGTSRNISTVSVSSILADTASTDIVIIANAGVQLTMPTAVGNTNLYTVKNTSVSSVMVVTTGAETIDDSANVIMPIQYTSIDLISDNSNWKIT